jgi:hypothetical protein
VRCDVPFGHDDDANPRGDGLVDLRQGDAAMPPVRAEAQWRERYRQLGQTLALLVREPEVDGKLLQRVARALNAHWSAVENVLYPLVESARKRPLAEQRALSARLRSHLAKATTSGVDRVTRQRHWRALEALFRKHVRLDEESIFPYLQAARRL